MTFLAWANGRKWHDWIIQGSWLCTVVIYLAKGWYEMAVLFLLAIMAVTLHQYIRDLWTARAHQMLELSGQQAILMKEAIKHLPPEKAQEFRKRHDALVKGLVVE